MAARSSGRITVMERGSSELLLRLHGQRTHSLIPGLDTPVSANRDQPTRPAASPSFLVPQAFRGPRMGLNTRVGVGGGRGFKHP
jgi:hypothetical protein